SDWQDESLTALCGGEALSPILAAELQRRAGAAWNLYGPTETTVWSAIEDLDSASVAAASGHGGVSIGRPIANTEIYVLGHSGEPQPVAADGEVLIGGAGLARGYRRRPGLTAERFVPDPFSGRRGARLYRTGDLARFTSDGRLEYRGRIDHQVKLRGFRIELGEIEAILLEHPTVAEVVVALHGSAVEEGSAEDQLIAYLVPCPEEKLEVADLRRAARAKLPDYMVPTRWVELEAIPLTPNRKVDRRRLPAPEAATRETETSTSTRTPLEDVLVSIWSQVLGRSNVGLGESFFDLGGHSLLATRVAARVRDALGVELPVERLFAAPTIELLAREIQSLDTATPMPTIEPAGRSGDLELSFSQRRQWFLDQLEPGTPALNLPFAVELHGQLAVDRLRVALVEVASRHEILRTRFVEQSGKPVQRIEGQPNLPLIEVDLAALSSASQQVAATRLAAQEANWSFRLDRLPLVRAVLLRLGDHHWRLLLTLHHIVVDGWSFHILLREVGQIYDALTRGYSSPLAPLPLQYADFAAWQNAYLQGETLEQQLAYWRQQLGDGGSPPLALPTDRPRPALQTFAGAREAFALELSTTDALRTLARRDSASLYMVLLAALSALLHRYTAQTDLSVGTFIAGRNRAEIEDLIGFFVNSLVLRVDAGEDPSFRQLLARARQVTLDAYSHQEIPFERLIEELQPERDLSRPAFFQVMLVLQNLPQASVDLEELRLETSGSGGLGRANFDFTLWLEETADGLSGYLDYNVDLFESSTACRLLRHFERLLEGVAEEADRRLSELSLMAPEETRQILVEWSGSPGSNPWHGGVYRLFERQVQQAPQAPALTWVGSDGIPRSWTYGELGERAGRLANRLCRSGVGRESSVAICLDRSPDLVATVLAVLATGGAYVPLDATYAGERLSYMLRQSAAPLLVTRSDLAASLSTAGIDCEVLCLDLEEASLEAESVVSPRIDVRPENLAYTVYTSGSTGRPKGVMVTQGGFENAFVAWEKRYRLGQEATCHLQMASFSFDVWSGDLVRALCSGGRLVLCPREFLLEPEALYALMVDQAVDAAEFVPAVARSLVDHLGKGQPSGEVRDLAFMRLMVVGSDIWYMREMESLAKLCGPATRVINSYGVSEATIDSTSFELSAGHSLHGERPVPIGRPFRGSRLYLVDSYGQPVPEGVPGELCLAGAGLARGYHASPALTAERFVPDPFAARCGQPAGARLYRSGDRARFLPGGVVEFLGRVDDQVKVRGFRIEPGEIEATLEELPGVRHAVVLARGEGQQEKRLVAYVVADGEAPVDTTALRALLGDRLADYMVPSFFVVLDELPLTPNGKVDRRSLPEPEWSRPDSAAAYVAPRTASEEALAEIVEELLGLERVGIYDNFFDLGGHSLLATQFLARIRQLFEVDVPLRAIFERPTVATLAVTVEELILAELQALEGELDDGDAGFEDPPVTAVGARAGEEVGR
ncbi:MAG: amino acid adenylation domain-containing protein, partial [Acidobacteriota bacterium]